MMTTNQQPRLSEEAVRALTAVREFLGRAFFEMPDRWHEAAERDPVALQKALRDTRQKLAKPCGDPVRSRGGYMWRAFLSQEALEKKHRTEGPRHG